MTLFILNKFMPPPKSIVGNLICTPPLASIIAEQGIVTLGPVYPLPPCQFTRTVYVIYTDMSTQLHSTHWTSFK